MGDRKRKHRGLFVFFARPEDCRRKLRLVRRIGMVLGLKQDSCVFLQSTTGRQAIERICGVQV